MDPANKNLRADRIVPNPIILYAPFWASSIKNVFDLCTIKNFAEQKITKN